VEGQDLFYVMEESAVLNVPIGIHALWIVLHDTSSSLTATHSQNRIHGDMKLENLLWDRDEQKVRLIDFEYTTEIGSEQKAGTPQYQAREVVCGDYRAHPSRDIWSFGITMFRLMTMGAMPEWQDEDIMNLPDCGLLSNVVWWMLAPNPEERPPSNHLLEIVDALLRENFQP
jgi:serine/threonine protein kinase